MTIPRTAFELGKDAQYTGLPISECPYDKEQSKEHWLDWRRGHMSGSAAEQASKVHYESGIVRAPPDDVTEVKTSPKETKMGKLGPDPFFTPPKPNKPTDTTKPKFLPKDQPWSKDAELHDEDDPDWQQDGEGWKDKK